MHAGIDANQTLSSGELALCVATESKSTDVVKELLAGTKYQLKQDCLQII